MKLIILLFAGTVWISAQTFYYDFGIDSAAHESDTSTVFLPIPPAGKARVRVGSGGGGFYLENPGIESFGSGSELKGVASATSSVNKFSIYNYPGGKHMYIAFYLRFSGGSSGKWYFCAGNGRTYSNNAVFRSDQSFIALRWTFLQPDSILCEYRKGGSWKKLLRVTGRQNETYYLELYGNNSADTLNYRKRGERRLGAYSFDFWVNDSLAAGELPKALLPDTLNINSFMFYGANSDSNCAVIRLDDVIYADSIAVSASSINHSDTFPAKPAGIIIWPNYPNPFNPTTNIIFSIYGKKPFYTVNMMIYDLRGALVDLIDLGRLCGGLHRYRWRAKKFMASGAYLIRLKADNFVESRKIFFLK